MHTRSNGVSKVCFRVHLTISFSRSWRIPRRERADPVTRLSSHRQQPSPLSMSTSDPELRSMTVSLLPGTISYSLLRYSRGRRLNDSSGRHSRGVYLLSPTGVAV